ncbi:MAG: DnaB-like helicase C-terminal domain-containing protein [bacterium]
MTDRVFERQVLCCILLDNKLIYQAIPQLSDDDFEDYRNVSIFRALKKLIVEEKRDADIALLRNLVDFEDSGSYLVDIFNALPTAGRIDNYIQQVKEYSAKRALYRHFLASTEEVKKLDKLNFKEWLNQKEAQFTGILNSYRKEVVKDSFNPKVYTQRMRFLYQQYRENQADCRGPKTGFRILDEMMGGLRLLNILAGTTGAGKSTLAQNIALNISIQQGIPVLYINYEMEADDLHCRMTSCLSQVKSDKIKAGRCSVQEWAAVDAVIDLIEKTGTLHITDNASRDINDTVALIHYYKQRFGVKVVFVDYIGEIEGDSLAHKERNEYITYGRYTQTLKNTCSSLGIHCFLVAQFNRQGDKDKSPQRSNIQGSWKLIQKADVFMALHYDDKEKQHNLTIQKQRHGKYPYKIGFNFHKDIHKFEEIPMMF